MSLIAKLGKGKNENEVLEEAVGTLKSKEDITQFFEDYVSYLRQNEEEIRGRKYPTSFYTLEDIENLKIAKFLLIGDYNTPEIVDLWEKAIPGMDKAVYNYQLTHSPDSI